MAARRAAVMGGFRSSLEYSVTAWNASSGSIPRDNGPLLPLSIYLVLNLFGRFLIADEQNFPFDYAEKLQRQNGTFYGMNYKGVIHFFIIKKKTEHSGRNMLPAVKNFVYGYCYDLPTWLTNNQSRLYLVYLDPRKGNIPSLWKWS